jgi:predicted transcriptional regulator
VEALNSIHIMRRSPLELRFAILRTLLNGPLGVTHLFYKSNTTWSTVITHINALIIQGLISKDPVLPFYSLTEQGMIVLREWNNAVTKVGFARELELVD